MGDHQDCHVILCILHILYPEVPNRGPGIVEFTLIGWMLARICFFKFSSRTFFLRLTACSNFLGGFLQPPPQISNGPSLSIQPCYKDKLTCYNWCYFSKLDLKNKDPILVMPK
jgi:hypothetical protein